MVQRYFMITVKSLLPVETILPISLIIGVKRYVPAISAIELKRTRTKTATSKTFF